MDYLEYFLFSLTVIAGLLICIWELYKKDKLKKYVSWCAADDPPNGSIGHVRSSSLLSEFQCFQNKNNIPIEYRINSKQEIEYAEVILSEYRNELSQLFFNNKLKLPETNFKYSLTNESYFIYSFRNFLDRHFEKKYDKVYFLGYEKEEFISFKKKKTESGLEYRTNFYALTDFGLVYEKMFYISCIACQKCVAIKPEYIGSVDCTKIKEKIDTKQFERSFYI